MNDIKTSKTRAQIAGQGGVPAHSPKVKPIRKIDGSHTALAAPPSKRTVFGRFRAGFVSQALVQAPIRSQHGDFMAKLRKSLGQSGHPRRWPAKFKKWFVALCDVQDSHSSRRILRNAFAKTGKRNSFCNRSRPRFPISRAWSGLASRASREVASCTGSPCCTR